MKQRMLTVAGTVAALAVLGLASGCNQNKDSGTVVTTPPASDPAAIQREIQEVQNNPNIPPEQKQAIVGRLQAGAGETQARKGSTKPGGGGQTPVPGTK